jgi:hypothetical protein
MFNLLKEVFKVHRFRMDEDYKAVVMQWFQQQARENHWAGASSRYLPLTATGTS